MWTDETNQFFSTDIEHM